jgi:hypothetical protein
MNLWCRVSDLERLGYQFRRDRVSVPTRDGSTHVTRYSLIAQP